MPEPRRSRRPLDITTRCSVKPESARNLVFVSALGIVAASHGPRAAQPGDAAALRTFVAREFGATPPQLDRLKTGEPFVTVLTGSVDREVAVAGAIRISGPARRTVDVLRDVERLERGKGFLHTQRLSEPPLLRDFDALRVSADDLTALRKCQPGRCDIKLGRGVFDLLARLDWRAPDLSERVNQLARQTAFEYLTAYRRGGNAELAVYADKDRPTFVAAEFADLVRRSSRLPNVLPELATYLLEYPRAARSPAVEDIFYWSEVDFGLKPVFRINHLVIHEAAGTPGPRYAVVTKQLYANHYFHAGLEVRALVDDTESNGAAHYLVVLNVARSDGLTGLFGGLVKGKVQGASRDGLQRALVATKARVEGRVM